MGASQWSHFGPYHEDRGTCFALLCQQVFNEKHYYDMWKSPEDTRRMIEQNVDAEIAEKGLDACLQLAQRVAGAQMQIQSRTDIIAYDMCYQPHLAHPPQTIEELLAYNGLEGTHSILDYAHDGTYRLLPPAIAARYLKPISAATLIHVFGTTHPTRRLIEEHEHALWEYVMTHRPDEGNSCLVYHNDVPTEMFVMGISGD